MTNDSTAGAIQPMSSITIDTFMRVYPQLCPTVDDEVSVEEVAAVIDWLVARVKVVAEWCRDRYLIDTDTGMGDEITVIEGQ